MNKPILFASTRKLERAENIKAVWDAYEGEKEFVQMDGFRDSLELSDSRRFSVLVTDEFVQASPGKCVMIGHGISGGKTFGLDQPLAYHRAEDGSLLSVVVTASHMTVNIAARQSGVDIGKVFPLGMPRTDYYFTAERKETGKRTYLFAPTYRADFEGIPATLTTDFDLIDSLLTDEEEMIIKAHMLDEDMKEDFRHIRIASSEEPSADYIVNCDVLITDFSSIMFDAYILEKPVVLFAKDKQTYLWHRGMYFDYEHCYSGRMCETEEELVKLIREAKEPTRIETIMRHITTPMCDGHSTERVVNLIRAMNEERTL